MVNVLNSLVILGIFLTVMALGGQVQKICISGAWWTLASYQQVPPSRFLPVLSPPGYWLLSAYMLYDVSLNRTAFIHFSAEGLIYITYKFLTFQPPTSPHHLGISCFQLKKCFWSFLYSYIHHPHRSRLSCLLLVYFPLWSFTEESIASIENITLFFFYNSDFYYCYFFLSIYYSCCNNRYILLCLTNWTLNPAFGTLGSY